MKLTRTVKLKIKASPSEVLPTITAATQCYNDICKKGWETDEANTVALHHLTYSETRKILPSALSVSVRRQASDVLSAVFKRRKKGEFTKCPKSQQIPVRLDKTAYNIWFSRREISIVTISGRKTFGFHFPEFFDFYLSWRRKSAEIRIIGDKVFVTVTFEKEVEEPFPNNRVIGVDQGINNMAVTSTGRFFKGGDLKNKISKMTKIRKELTQKGTRSAKRHLRRLAKKENRFRRDAVHCVAKAIVAEVNEGDTIVLENLKGIRNASKKFRKKQRASINSWSFGQLELFIRDKAAVKGCLVRHVDARYTSQKCSSCGHTERGNRKSQSVFKCKHCGKSLNADFNASVNIAKNFQDAICHLGRASVDMPIVTA